MKRQWIFFCLLLLAGLASCPRTFAQAEKERVYQEADLPTGGKLYPHPQGKREVYYLVSDYQLQQDVKNWKKRAGLYRSADGGKTWVMLNSYLKFTDFLIHPHTGKLFASIEDGWLEENSWGHLVTHWSSKAVTSDDGRAWKDITGKKKHVSEINGVFPDPDHPDRVCLSVSSIRPYVLQAKDDEYSDWVWIKIWHWREKHPPKTKEVEP